MSSLSIFISKYLSNILKNIIVGITSIEEGCVENNILKLSSTNISRISFSKEPYVTKLERTIKLLDNETLEQVILMETNKTPLCKHLDVKYKKV